MLSGCYAKRLQDGRYKIYKVMKLTGTEELATVDGRDLDEVNAWSRWNGYGTLKFEEAQHEKEN